MARQPIDDEPWPWLAPWQLERVFTLIVSACDSPKPFARGPCCVPWQLRFVSGSARVRRRLSEVLYDSAGCRHDPKAGNEYVERLVDILDGERKDIR